MGRERDAIRGWVCTNGRWWRRWARLHRRMSSYLVRWLVVGIFQWIVIWSYRIRVVQFIYYLCCRDIIASCWMLDYLLIILHRSVCNLWRNSPHPLWMYLSLHFAIRWRWGHWLKWCWYWVRSSRRCWWGTTPWWPRRQRTRYDRSISRGYSISSWNGWLNQVGHARASGGRGRPRGIFIWEILNEGAFKVISCTWIIL